MKLYSIHCGFYDPEAGDGIYESHLNLYVAAESFEDAKLRAKALAIYKQKRMHVDGMQEIRTVDGFHVELRADAKLAGQTEVIGSRHRELAPKPTT